MSPLKPRGSGCAGRAARSGLLFYRAPQGSSAFAGALSSEHECWWQDLSAAALAGPDSLAGDELNQYVRDGRPNIMTLEQVVQRLCSARNRNYLMGELTDEEAATRLKALML